MQKQDQNDNISCQLELQQERYKQYSKLHLQQPSRQSQDWSKYQSYFKTYFNNGTSTQQIHTRLSEHQIQRQPNFVSKMQVEIIHKDKDSMRLQLKWGNFKMQINLLKIFMDFEQFNRKAQFKSGGFGKIFFLTTHNMKYTMKSIECQNQLSTLYEQYFIAKICSILKIGSAVFSLFGYDILLFNNKDGQFIMEECNNFVDYQKTNIKEIQTQIGKSVHLMHQLHICHCDIKPQNIMFSRTYNKYVLIDFGLSRFVKEDIGMKSLCQFFGTYRNSSPQMKKLYFLKKSSFIDLYYNDLFGLLSSLDFIGRRIKVIQSQTWQQQQTYHLIPILYYIKLFNAKYCLFSKNYKRAIQFILQESYLRRTAKKVFLQQILPLNITQLKQQIQNAKYELQIHQKGSVNSLDQEFVCYLSRFYQNINVDELSICQLFVNKTLQHKNDNKFQYNSPIIIQNLFSNIAKLFQIQQQAQLNETQGLTMINLIQKIYAFGKPSFFNQQNLQFEPSLLYKTQEVLRLFMQIFIQQNNMVQLQRVRVIFVLLQNYQAAHQIQQILLDKFHENANKFFILRCKFFCGRKFWCNNICYHICKDWIQQVQQKSIEESSQNCVILSNLKKFSLNLLSATISQESRQKWENALKTIKQFKYSSSFFKKEKQDLIQLAEKIGRIIDLLNKFRNTNVKYESYLIKMLRRIHDQNHISKFIYPFLKFGHKKYIHILFYTTDSDKTIKLYKQYLSLFRKDTKMYIYQVQYFLQQFIMRNSHLNSLLLNQFIQNIQKYEVHTYTHALSNLNTLNTFFYKIYHHSRTFHRICPKLAKDLTLFYHNIITYSKQNGYRQKMDPGHLIFCNFYISLINQGLQISIDNLLLFFQENSHMIYQECAQISLQIINSLRVISLKSTYKQQQINLLIKKMYVRDEQQINMNIWATQKFAFKIDELVPYSGKLSAIFFTFQTLVMNLKIHQSAEFASQYIETAIHKNALNMAKLMALQQIRKVLENWLKSFSLKLIADNYLLSILIFNFFIYYVENFNHIRQKLRAIKIAIQQKQSITFDLQKKKRILILCLFGIKKIKNIGLKKSCLRKIYKMKDQSKSKRKKLITLRTFARSGQSQIFRAYIQTIERNIQQLNAKSSIVHKIRTKLNKRITSLENLYYQHK